MKTLRILIAQLLLVVGIASTLASGGGGGGINECILCGFVADPFPDSLPPTRDWVDIDAANAQLVAATVVQAGNLVFDFSTVIGGQIFPSLPSAPDLLSSNSKFETIAAVAITGGPISEACAESGTITVSGRAENDPLTLSEKDIFDLEFDACDDGDGYIIDGRFTLWVSELEGDPRTDVFRLRYVMWNLDVMIAAGVHSYSAAEGLTLIWNSLAFPEIVLNPTSYPVQLSSQADGYRWSGDQSLTFNADPFITMTSAEGSSFLGSEQLGGSVNYETIVPLQASAGQAPELGEILVSEGDNNGTIHIVIESSASVRLDIDADGDGILDDVQFTTWAALHE